MDIDNGPVHPVHLHSEDLCWKSLWSFTKAGDEFNDFYLHCRIPASGCEGKDDDVKKDTQSFVLLEFIYSQEAKYQPTLNLPRGP